MQSEWNMAKIVNKYPVGIQTFEEIREKNGSTDIVRG